MFEEENIDTGKNQVEYRTIEYDGHKFKVKSDGTIYLMPATRDRHNPKHNYWTKGEKGKDGRMYFMSMPVDQIVLSAYQGKPIYSSEIEHIDKDLTNNRIENLRVKEYIQNCGMLGLFNDGENEVPNGGDIHSDPDLERQFAYLIKYNKEREEALKEEERRRQEEEKKEREEILRQVEIRIRRQQKYAVKVEEEPQQYRNPLYPKPSMDSYLPYKPEYYRYDYFSHSRNGVYDDVKKSKRKEKDGQLLTYALDENNELVYVDDVENGNDCGCRCPHCKEPLCAENGGKKKVHYFSHRNNSDCVGACEAALHLLAKKVLQNCKVLQTPVFVDGKVERLEFDRVNVEVLDAITGRKPDCVAYRNGEKPLWVEFRNTHAVDDDKIKVIRNNAIECIEVDLGWCELDEENLKQFLTTSIENRIWIYSERNEAIIREEYKRRLDAYNKQVEDYEDRVMFAYKDSNEVIHVDDARGKKCHCILCGRPMEILFENNSYYFHHLGEKCQFEEEKYCKFVIKSLIEKCVKEGRLVIDLKSEGASCKQISKCPLPGESCRNVKQVHMDMCKFGFARCEQGVPINGIELKSDLVLIGEKGRVHIVLDKNDEYNKAQETVISVSVIYEEISNLLNYKELCRATINRPIKEVDRKLTGRKIRRFNLYRSGKYHIEEIDCRDFDEEKCKKTLLAAMNIYSAQDKDLCERLAVYVSKKGGYAVCPCLSCFHLKKTFDGIATCNKHYTANTPYTPLSEEKWPIDCESYAEDYSLKSALKEFRFEKRNY